MIRPNVHNNTSQDFAGFDFDLVKDSLREYFGKDYAGSVTIVHDDLVSDDCVTIDAALNKLKTLAHNSAPAWTSFEAPDSYEVYGICVDASDSRLSSLEPSLILAKGAKRQAIYLLRIRHLPKKATISILNSCPVHRRLQRLVIEEGSQNEHYPTVAEVRKLFGYSIDMDTPVTVARGPNMFAGKGHWNPITSSLGNFIESVTTHQPGAKNGACILQGECTRKTRKDAYMKENHFLILDYDTGTTFEEIDEAFRSKKLAYARYTSFSHNKRISKIKRKHFFHWAGENAPIKAESVAKYLTDKKDCKPEIVKGLTISNENLDDSIIVKHRPMQKHRVILILKEPFDFQIGNPVHGSRITEWKERYSGFAEEIGLPWDRSCVNPGRIFFLPRFDPQKGIGDHEADFFDGDRLDLSTVTRMRVRGSKLPNGTWSTTAIPAKTFEIGGMPADKWFRKPGKRFDVVEFIQENAPDSILIDNGDKLEVICPHDELHSESEETGCFVHSRDEEPEKSFAFHCMHDHCADLDPVDRMHKLLQILEKEGVEYDLKEHTHWLEDDIDEEEQFEDLKAKAEALTKDTSPDELDGLMGQIAEVENSTSRDRLGKIAAAKTKTTASEVKSNVKGKVKERIAVEQAEKNEKSAKVVIGVGADFSHKLEKVNQAIEQSNKPARLFVLKDYVLGRVIEDEVIDQQTAETKTTARLQTFTRDAMRHEINRVCSFQKPSEAAGQPPQEVGVCNDILSDFSGQPIFPLPPFERIVHTPIFSNSGKLVQEPGYDVETRCYYDPSIDIPEVPAKPSDKVVDRAVELIDEAVCDFPFDDDGLESNGASSYANFFAMYLQPFMRSMITGSCPGYFIDKPTPATGGSLLGNVFHIIHTGEFAAPSTFPSGEDEVRKEIMAKLICGQSVIFYDNIDGDVDSATLANLLSSNVISGRVLQSSTDVTLPMRQTLMLCGNNVSFKDELVRRVLPVRLDCKEADPGSRTVFRHPDLVEWLFANRGDLIWAGLVLVQNWIAAGRVKNNQRLASFEGWAGTLGGVLDAAGIGGFMGNIDRFAAKHKNELATGSGLAEMIYRKCGTRPFIVADIFEGLFDDYGNPQFGLSISNRDDAAKARQQFGMYLGKTADRVFDIVSPTGAKKSVQLKKQTEKRGGATVYCLLDLKRGE